MSDSVRPHRWQPTRLPCPWDSPGKNTGVGCHFLLQCMKVKSESESLSHVLLCATLWTGTCQGPLSIKFSRQEYWSWLPFPSPGDLSDPGIEPGFPTLQEDSLPSEPPGKPFLDDIFSNTTCLECLLCACTISSTLFAKALLVF